ncbi:MAG: hypothetical protein K5776_09195 [Lachnospiraceae bacterium]|nr:hypothetical protein [Lachnospiraceae bacterium]
MVLTIVIMAVLIIFVFSLILISYNLYESQNRNLVSARNSEAVNTLDQALKRELTDKETSSNSALWKYLRSNIAYDISGTTDTDWKDWPYYVEGETTGPHSKDFAIRKFNLESNSHIDGMPAKTTVAIYWTVPDDYNPADFVTNMNAGNAPKGVKLHITVKAETANHVYETTSVYKLTTRGANQTEKVLNQQIFASPVNNPAGHTLTENGKGEKWVWKYVGKE